MTFTNFIKSSWTHNIIWTNNSSLLFAEPKKFILVEVPFCISNENTVKRFVDNLQSFVHHKSDVTDKWYTKEIRSLSRLKDKNPYPACTIYKGTYSCSANYIGETKRNAETWWNEHKNPHKDSVAA